MKELLERGSAYARKFVDFVFPLIVMDIKDHGACTTVDHDHIEPPFELYKIPQSPNCLPHFWSNTLTMLYVSNYLPLCIQNYVLMFGNSYITWWRGPSSFIRNCDIKRALLYSYFDQESIYLTRIPHMVHTRKLKWTHFQLIGMGCCPNMHSCKAEG